MSTTMLDGMKDPGWLKPLEARAWRGWLATNDLLRAQMARDLAQDSGLSDADYVVLVYLSETPGNRIRMSELASALRWSKSRLSHQITRMENRGLVARQECPSDARGSFAGLTETGLAEIIRAAPSHVAGVRRNFIDLLSEQQLEALSEITDVITNHLLGLPGNSWPCAAALGRPGDAGSTVGP